MAWQCATQIKTFTAVTIDALPISLLKSLVHFHSVALGPMVKQQQWYCNFLTLMSTTACTNNIAIIKFYISTGIIASAAAVIIHTTRVVHKIRFWMSCSCEEHCYAGSPPHWAVCDAQSWLGSRYRPARFSRQVRITPWDSLFVYQGHCASGHSFSTVWSLRKKVYECSTRAQIVQRIQRWTYSVLWKKQCWSGRNNAERSKDDNSEALGDDSWSQ